MAMDCLCILDNNFNFTINYKDDYLVFTDLSKWTLSLEQLLELENESSTALSELITAEISLNQSSFKFDLLPYRSTLIKYSEFDKIIDETSNAICGIDGIFTFEITACDSTQIINRSYAVLSSLECAYNKLLLSEDCDNALELLKLIEMIKANAEIQDYDKVSSLFTIAVALVKKLKCSCNDIRSK